MRRRKASQNSSAQPPPDDDHKHEHKHDDEPTNDADFSHVSPDGHHLAGNPSSSSASVTMQRANQSVSGDSDDLQILDDDSDDDSDQLDRRRHSGAVSSLDPPRPSNDQLDSAAARNFMIASSDDEYDMDEEDDVDLFSKIDFSDLDIDAMNAKLVVFMIFLFGLYALIFFSQGSSYVVGYLFILLLLCLVGIYGAFSFRHTALKVFWIGLLVWTLVCSVTFIGLVFTGSVDTIAEGRCANEEFNRVISEFNGRDCIDEVTKQLIWESTGTAVALVLLLLWCSYSIRKFQRKVKRKWDMEEFNDYSLR